MIWIILSMIVVILALARIVGGIADKPAPKVGG